MFLVAAARRSQILNTVSIVRSPIGVEVQIYEKLPKCASWLTNLTVPWEKVSAVFACRLIALEKKLGVRPIGIGETLR